MIPGREIHRRTGRENIRPIRRKHNLIINSNLHAPRHLRVECMTTSGADQQIPGPCHGLHVVDATINAGIRPVKTQPPINPRDSVLSVSHHTMQPWQRVLFIGCNARRAATDQDEY